MDECLLILGRSRVRTVSFWFCSGVFLSNQNVEKLVKLINMKETQIPLSENCCFYLIRPKIVGVHWKE